MVPCEAKKALALAYSIILSGEKISEQTKSEIESVLKNSCSFRNKITDIVNREVLETAEKFQDLTLLQIELKKKDGKT